MRETQEHPSGEAGKRRPRLGNGPFVRLVAGVLAAVAMELANVGLGVLTPVPTLEPLPVVAFLAGILFGWAGVAGCALGQIAYRFWLYDPMSWFDQSAAVSEATLSQCYGIPLSYALIGIAACLVFRLSAGVGRGFPNPASYVALVVAAGAGGMLTALALNLQFEPTLKGFLVHSASNFVSILLVCPPVLLIADRWLRPLMAQIPGEQQLAVSFPANLDLEDATRGSESDASASLEARLAIIGATILAITVVVVALAHQIPQVGGWPLLGYLGPVVWTALVHGMRGGLLATSLSGVLYLLGRSWIDRGLLPDDPDVYAVGLYADFVVFSLIGVFLGSEREEEIRLRSELAERAQQVTNLNEMGDLLQASVGLSEAYEVTSHGVQRLFPTESGALGVLKESSTFLEVVVAWGGAAPAGEQVFEPEDCWALRRGQVHYVEDPGRSPVCRHLAQRMISSYLCVPLMAQGEILGVLHIQKEQNGPDPEQEGLTDPKREMAIAAGKEIALALGNLRLRETLHEQSIRDPLTGLFNRRYMAETLERERYRALRQDLSFGVIMIDIDHFKRYNDTFGHEAGDVVLREIGKFLQTRARREDIVCRYGGEEFVIVLSEASLEITERRADDLRDEVKGLRLRHDGQVLGAITMSFGVSSFPQHGKSEKDVLRAADAALYRAKAGGRDRVMVAEVVG